GDYARVLADMRTHDGATSESLRRDLAAAGFAHTAAYDHAISAYLDGGDVSNTFPDIYAPRYRKRQELRYGENPHQSAVLYAADDSTDISLVTAEQHQGKALSYHNLADADAALACVRAFGGNPTCVIVKHANPCGVASGDDLTTAYQRAFATDPVSAFGGILAFNTELDATTAAAIVANQFAEVILAPRVSPAALASLQKKKNRSEERRVGKECRSRWTTSEYKENIEY